jgi:Ca2+-binding RTX toxin-like protein
VVNLVSSVARTSRETDTLSSVENVTGSFGNDIITGDAEGNVLHGLDGEDVIRGGDGDDSIRGGLNSLFQADRVDILTGGPGDDLIDGGSPTDVNRQGQIIDGRDEVNYSDAQDGAIIDLGAGTAQGNGIDTLVRIEDVVGSGGDDTIIGSAGPNELNGSAGDDDISGTGGDDELEGSAGDDDFDGGEGLDVLEFTQSGSGITANLASGTATGQGTDTIVAVENLSGSIFDDDLFGDDGPNRILGSLGDDSMSGAGGDDEILGRAGSDDMDGGDGNDSFIGSIGSDSATGGSGADYMALARGDDSYTGGPDVDTLDFSTSPNAVDVNLITGLATGDGSDTVAEVENVIGTNRPDEILGDGADNRLVGLDGLDRLLAGDGDDFIQGGNGQDALDGSAGSDTVSFEGSQRPVTADLLQGFAEGEGSDTLVDFENVVGSLFSDFLRGDDQSNSIMALGGDDVLEGRGGDDELNGGEDADVGDGGDGIDLCLLVEFASNCEG